MKRFALTRSEARPPQGLKDEEINLQFDDLDDGFFKVQSWTDRETGRHHIRYRSLQGLRMAVTAESVLAGAMYTGVDSPSDHVSEVGTAWSHNGRTAPGSRSWGTGVASYSIDAPTDGAVLPKAAVRALVAGDPPFDKTATGTTVTAVY